MDSCSPIGVEDKLRGNDRILNCVVNRIIKALTGKINNDEGLMRPIKRKSDPMMGPDAVLVMIPSDLDYLVNLNNEKKILRFSMEFFKLFLVKDGEKGTLTLAGPFLGAPQAVMGMEKMIALGAKRFWVLGWCGSLQPDLRIGDLVIPSSSISEEGTSLHYPIGERLPATDEGLNQILENTLKKKGQSYLRGTIWTTDAPYRETPLKVREYQEKGILAVEMEMSALMTLAIFRKVSLAGLLVVSDELFELKWHPGFSSPELKRSSRLAGEHLLNIVEWLSGENGRDYKRTG